MALWIACFVGCGRDEIAVYRVAKEPSAPALPPGWEVGPPSEMRVASFRVKGAEGKLAEVSVVPLPGMAGRDLDNVNRWRGQLGLGPVAESELSKLAEPVEIAGSKGQLYEFSGESSESHEKARMLAAILLKGDVAWFFKMAGDDELVAQQKPAFLGYLKTFQFPGTPAQTPSSIAGVNDLPSGHPPIGNVAPAAAPQTPSTSQSKPSWAVPTNWREVEAGGFLVAKFVIANAGSAQAAVNVSMSSGEGGGLLLNVNRWRKQLGLEEVDQTGAKQLAQPLDAGGAHAMLISMEGTDPRSGDKARMIAAIVPQPGRTWFYKLMGPPTVVEQEKDSFLKFIRTAKYPQ